MIVISSGKLIVPDYSGSINIDTYIANITSKNNSINLLKAFRIYEGNNLEGKNPDSVSNDSISNDNELSFSSNELTYTGLLSKTFVFDQNSCFKINGVKVPLRIRFIVTNVVSGSSVNLATYFPDKQISNISATGLSVSGTTLTYNGNVSETFDVTLKVDGENVTIKIRFEIS